MLLAAAVASPATALAVAYYPLYHLQEGDETAAAAGQTIYLFFSGTDEERRSLHEGDILAVSRIDRSCDAAVVGKIRVLGLLGETYLKAEVVGGADQDGRHRQERRDLLPGDPGGALPALTIMGNEQHERRPSPETLLRLAQEEEAAHGRGRLKLFFGMCPGVGKTYAMLEAARQRLAEAREVVVGLVETHGRRETEALLEGLVVLPRRRVTHQGLEFGEFDLDAALARNPRLILVDELAHTNAPGSRHAKRWQDVAELLDAGIDVYTTLNVQHWESLNDVVAQITGRVIRETVPDTFLRRADEIELVDLPPEDLLQRLREGKVYRGGTAERAADSFFRTGNLIALRELALRHVAERVDAQMQAFRERHEIPGVWAVGEQLLVGISSGPMTRAPDPGDRAARDAAARHLDRRLRRDPGRAGAARRGPRPGHRQPAARGVARRRDDHALRPERHRGAAAARQGAQRHQDRPRQARAAPVEGVAPGLGGQRDGAALRRRGSLRHQRVRLRPERAAPAGRPQAGALGGDRLGGAAVIGATLLSWPLFRVVDRANLIMIYLLGVSWVAYRHGRIPALVASAASVLAFDFFFVPPYLTFSVSDTQYLFTFAAMLGVGILISTIADRLRRQNEQMRRTRGAPADPLPAEPGTLRDPGAAAAPRDRPGSASRSSIGCRSC